MTAIVDEVETVRGPVPTAELGVTLMHEHVFVLTPDSQRNWEDGWDEDERMADAVENWARGAGFRVERQELETGQANVLVTLDVPGATGTLLFEAIQSRQYIALQSLVAIIAVGYVLVNFLVDVLYAVLDPRIRHARS